MRLRGEMEPTFYEQYGKRMLDIITALVLIMLTWPILLLAFFAIMLTSGSPILFTQKRVGQYGEVFTIWKFRTMELSHREVEIDIHANDGVPNDFLFKCGKDKRITKVGAILRKYSIDELPQLFNVLKGNMSIVGPRPEIPAITELYNDYQKQRLEVKPGLTGFAQVSGRSIIPHGRKIELDLAYIEKQSFLFDLKIILLTFIVVVTTKGAF